MAAAKDPEPQGSPDVSSVRDAAKWLVTAFAAVGAALLGGIQFSEIGALKDAALFAAIGGFVLALTGIGLAIWWTSDVLVTRIVSTTALQSDAAAVEFIDSHRDVVGREYSSFAVFMAAREAAWLEWNQPQAAGIPDEDWAKKRTALRGKLEHLENVATRVAQIWRFEKICRTFTEARYSAFLGAGLAAVGVVVFTCATHAKDPSPFAKSPSAVTVTYTLRPDSYNSLLGPTSKDCLPVTGSATLLDGWPKGTDLLIVADPAKCPPLRLRWDETLGTLRATQTANVSAAKHP